MLLRKINAGLSLLTTALFLDHAIFMSVWMLSRCSIQKGSDVMSYILAIAMLLHAVLSILFAILGHKNAEKRKTNLGLVILALAIIVTCVLFILSLNGVI
jgi:MFS-type transporter involved in bile tolerance (Atg22 family)